MEQLAMKVGHIHAIAVDDAKPPHTSRGEIHRDWRSQSTRADDEDARALETLLSLGSHVREAYLASIAGDLVGAELPRQIVHLKAMQVGRMAVTRRRFHVLTRDLEAPKYTRPSEDRTGVSWTDVARLLKRLFGSLRNRCE